VPIKFFVPDYRFFAPFFSLEEMSFKIAIISSIIPKFNSIYFRMAKPEEQGHKPMLMSTIKNKNFQAT
jgi:hypothetical protein